MSARRNTPALDRITSPADLRSLRNAELRAVADDLRIELIDAVSVTGGHLGAGLGVVELTVALHAVFDTPHDKLIWDVSHQAYPHKILTDRRDRIRTLRQRGGLSGFTRRDESPFDPFGAAHSSTSISAALGFAAARAMGADDVGECIAVIGDGALSAGMAFEAMNNAGALRERMIVIVNDNDMSIAPPTGALARTLADLYAKAPLRAFGEVLGRLELDLGGAIARAREALEERAFGGTFFEQLGFDYVGPIDGHDLNQLLPVLRAIQSHATGPTLLHVLTQKGKGFAPAEASKDKWHGVPKFDASTGARIAPKASAPSYTKIFADTLIDVARKDPSICAVTAAMPDGTGIGRFAEHFPDRSFDVGIAEQHAVTFAAGLAASGKKPFCTLYSTFLQRGYDQVIHDVALQNLPVRFAIDRAGLVGADGPSHAGAFDIAYLGCVPNMVVMAAADEAELARMVLTAAAHDTGPIAFRYPRGAGTGVTVPADPAPLKIGKGRLIEQGADIAILSFGARLPEVQVAASLLAHEGHGVTIADARFAKPLDRTLILDLARSHLALITIEEGSVGGFGSQVAHLLAHAGVFDTGLCFRSMVLPDRFIDHGSLAEMYSDAGLDAAAIADRVRDVANIIGKGRSR